MGLPGTAGDTTAAGGAVGRGRGGSKVPGAGPVCAEGGAGGGGCCGCGGGAPGTVTAIGGRCGSAGRGCRGPERICPGRVVGSGLAGMAIVR